MDSSITIVFCYILYMFCQFLVFGENTFIDLESNLCNWSLVLNKTFTSKYLKVANVSFSTPRQFIRGFHCKMAQQNSIHNIAKSVNSFCIKVSRQLFSLHGLSFLEETYYFIQQLYFVEVSQVPRNHLHTILFTKMFKYLISDSPS